jgi:hypothetical protein
MDKTRGLCRGVIVLLAIAWMLTSLGGCTRRFFRKQADAEVAEVLKQKDVFADWKIENMHVYPHKDARFADWTNPDRPPMPPDDPAAQKLGPNPQKARHVGVERIEGAGYLDLMAAWDAQNRAERSDRAGMIRLDDAIRNYTEWQKYNAKGSTIPPPAETPKITDNPFVLTIEQAMELGLINSREMQTRREDLYLSALPVTRERFAFAAQYFAVGQALRERSSALITGGSDQGNRYSSAVGVSKLFSTGALLLVALANQTVVDLTNPTNKHVTSVSTINLDAIQPLLRGGSRAVTLEPLTLVERTLLYEIRNYMRFRREFFQYMIGGSNLSIAAGLTNPGSLASSRVLFGTAAGGNIGRQQVVPAGLGAVGGAAVPGTLFLGVNTAALSEGYLPTLFKDAILHYELANVEALKSLVPFIKESSKGGLVSELQVEQVRLQLLQSQNSLFLKIQDRDTSIDSFKLQLGIPEDVPLQFDDASIRAVTEQITRYDRILDDWKCTVTGDERKPITDPCRVSVLEKIYRADRPTKIRGDLEGLIKGSPLTRATERFPQLFLKEWKRWEKEYPDDKTLEAGIKKTEALVDEKKFALRKVGDQDLKLKQKLQAEFDAADYKLSIGRFERSVRRYETEPWQKEKKLEHEKRLKQTEYWKDLSDKLAGILIGAKRERFELLRTRWETLAPVVVNDIDLFSVDADAAYEMVTQVALENRLDLMNTRAQTVDAWRQLRVFANGLQGVFNLAYHMDSTTPPDGNSPLAFQSNRTRHQLVMNFELPIVRLTERNAYRASLIAYQRARRDLQQKEDTVVQQVRLDLRQLQVLRENLNIQQEALELAYRQLDSSYEIFKASQATDPGGAAALTNQLLQSYSRLPQAQQQLLKTWIDYQVARQQLYLDLELMPLDARGVWIDEFANRNFDGPPGQLERQRDQPAPAKGP